MQLLQIFDAADKVQICQLNVPLKDIQYIETCNDDEETLKVSNIDEIAKRFIEMSTGIDTADFAFDDGAPLGTDIKLVKLGIYNVPGRITCLTTLPVYNIICATIDNADIITMQSQTVTSMQLELNEQAMNEEFVKREQTFNHYKVKPDNIASAAAADIVKDALKEYGPLGFCDIDALLKTKN